MNSLDGRECSMKELPTRELKLKRHKVRKDSPTIPPVRLRLKSNISPLHCENDVEKCFSDRSVSSSPDSITQEHSPVFATSPYKVYAQMNSLPSSPTVNECNESCEPFHIASPLSDYKEHDLHDDYDQPLDMSRKRMQDVSVPSLQCQSQSSHQQQLRPSVITCASALLRTQCSLSDLAHHICTANVGDCINNDMDENRAITDFSNNKGSNNEPKIVRPGHRREIVSGSCDPVIDEHFRRSLGKDYQHIFSKSSGNSVSITVDDHFAKALGDTWHQLQQSKAVSVDSVTSTHSPNSVQAQQPHHHQSPEILS